jgi:hypothetical protein
MVARQAVHRKNRLCKVEVMVAVALAATPAMVVTAGLSTYRSQQALEVPQLVVQQARLLVWLAEAVEA